MSYTYSSTLFLASFRSFSSLSCMIIFPWGTARQGRFNTWARKSSSQENWPFKVGGFNHESARRPQVPHSPQKDSACQLRVATVDCFQLVVPSFLFWLWAFWLGAAGQTFSRPCPPLWWSKKIQENNQKSNHSTTLTQLLTTSLKKWWFGWDFSLLSGDGLGTLPSFLILILHKTGLLTSISSFSRGFSSGSFGLSPWFCCSSWSVCILFWWTNTFGH